MSALDGAPMAVDLFLAAGKEAQAPAPKRPRSHLAARRMKRCLQHLSCASAGTPTVVMFLAVRNSAQATDPNISKVLGDATNRKRLAALGLSAPAGVQRSLTCFLAAGKAAQATDPKRPQGAWWRDERNAACGIGLSAPTGVQRLLTCF